MNKIVFFIFSILVGFAFAEAPVESGEYNIRRLADELSTLQRFVYKRFGGDPSYQEAGVNPPQDPAETMLLEKISQLTTRFENFTNKIEEMQYQTESLKDTIEKKQKALEEKISQLEKQLTETKDTVRKTDELAYQDKLNKMTADELILHIETSGRVLPEERFEKALRLFSTKFPEDNRSSLIYKELMYLTYKKEHYKEAALYAGEFYKKSPDSPETPEILLMMAFALAKLEKYKEACMTVSKIKTDYPNTSEDFKERLNNAHTSFSCPI